MLLWTRAGGREGGTSINDALPGVVRRGLFFLLASQDAAANPKSAIKAQKLGVDFLLCLGRCFCLKQLVRPRSNTGSRGIGCDTYRLRVDNLSNTVVSLGNRASLRADCSDTTSMHTKPTAFGSTHESVAPSERGARCMRRFSSTLVGGGAGDGNEKRVSRATNHFARGCWLVLASNGDIGYVG